MIDQTLCTPVWQLIGMSGNVPGLLELGDGRLSFTTEAGRVFDTPVSEVGEIRFPWYYFGGGANFKVGTASYRISFVKPNGAGDVPDRLLAHLGDGVEVAAGILTIGRKVSDLGKGRKAGKAWKSVLLPGA
jgi:hypothetical protein